MDRVGLRKRRRGPLTVDDEEESKVVRAIKKLDAFPQSTTDACKPTALSGGISLAVTILMMFVALSELLSYVAGSRAWREELSVDSIISHNVEVQIDLTFPNMQCQDVRIDIVDVWGHHTNDVHTDIFMSPVDAQGTRVYTGWYKYVPTATSGPYDPRRDPYSPHFCGDCYVRPRSHHHNFDKPGGRLDMHTQEAHANECCNTCEDVIAFYAKHGISPPHLNEIEQCLFALFPQFPGCAVNGTLLLPRIKGNFHIMPGHAATLHSYRSGELSTAHLHTVDPETAASFNASHIINHLSFGPKGKDYRRPPYTRVVGAGGRSRVSPHSPLDGTTTAHRDQHAYKYSLRVVPTTYDWRTTVPQTVHSFEYSASLFAHKNPLGEGKPPGLWFMFDFVPVRVTHIFERPTFGRLLVRVRGAVPLCRLFACVPLALHGVMPPPSPAPLGRRPAADSLLPMITSAVVPCGRHFRCCRCHQPDLRWGSPLQGKVGQSDAQLHADPPPLISL